MHHFKAIGEFKLDLPPGNAQFGSKSAIVCPAWPSHNNCALTGLCSLLGGRGCERQRVQPRRLVWYRRLLNEGSNYWNYAWPWNFMDELQATPSSVHHLIAICEFKLELQSGNARCRSKSTGFFNRVTLKFDRWPCKTIGHPNLPISSFVHHFVAIGKFKLELQSGNAQFGSKSAIFCLLWPRNLTNDIEKQ